MNRNDILWKGILEDIFADFLTFFVPEASQLLDFDRGFEFLDKELEQLFPPEPDTFKPRHVDKLVKAFTRDGQEQWILIHVEVQGKADKSFSQRMFTYYSRIFDQHQRPITAFAILADETKSFRPTAFEQSFMGTTLVYRFNTYKILGQDQLTLEASENPFAMVVLTVLVALQKKRVDEADLLDLKLTLTKRLLDKPFPKPVIRQLMNFLRNYVRFAKPETNVIFEDEYNELTKQKTTMGLEELLLTLAEQRGEKRGEKRGERRGEKQGRQQKDRLIITNLINGSAFNDDEIARFVGVEASLVAKIRADQTPKNKP